jgi:hypothetical protein
MTKRSSSKSQSVPAAFDRHNRDTFQRTVRLTQQAIAQLQADGKTVTLAAVCELTPAFDEHHKGLAPVTILRNSEAAELFRQHSPAYQARLHKQRQAKRRVSKPKTASKVAVAYRGLRTTELIQIAEDLKAQIAALKTLQIRLQAERDEAYRLRDETVQQNLRQLAALTQALPTQLRFS